MNEIIAPFDFLSNVANYSVIFILIIIFYLKKYISKNKSFFLILSSLSPFFFNDFLFPWEYMYDQIRYVKATNYLRNFDFSSAEFEFGRIGSTVRFASYIYFLIPLPFVVHISSIAFMNKFLYLCLYVYLNKNKYLDKYIDIFYLIFPSLILYTSVSLRDTIIFVLSVIILILYFKKKYFSTLIAILLLFLNRDVMAVITVIVLSMHYVFLKIKLINLNLYSYISLLELVYFY